MSLKKIHEIIVSPRVQVRTYKDSEWGEFQTRVYRDGKFRESETNHETDRESAILTAQDMARRLETRQNPSRTKARAIGEAPRSRTEVSLQKREAHLAKRVEALVISLGGKRFLSPGYPLEIETKHGILAIDPNLGWIATRFEDAARGQRAGAGQTGKWNFFPRGESIKAYDELFETFAASLRRIL